NNRNHYSTFVPPRKTLTLSLCNPSASLARRITPAALQLSASARFLYALKNRQPKQAEIIILNFLLI
ncbi:hypothetical protein, partial [Phascolarctobacterium faecium]|uniref:hypothetical protein n=1 Tax=Phascolarctobacterium faecium TaxID=33025 RepID=UPI002431BE2B